MLPISNWSRSFGQQIFKEQELLILNMNQPRFWQVWCGRESWRELILLSKMRPCITYDRRSSVELKTCVIEQPNQRRSFSFYASGNAGHCHVTITCVNDLCVTYSQIASSLKTPNRHVPCNAPRTREFITLPDDRHAWTDRNYLAGKGRKCVKNTFNIVFLHEITFEMH